MRKDLQNEALTNHSIAVRCVDPSLLKYLIQQAGLDGLSRSIIENIIIIYPISWLDLPVEAVGNRHII